MKVNLTRTEMYYLAEILMHEWYDLKESENRDILVPFLDRMSEKFMAESNHFSDWDEFVKAAKKANKKARVAQQVEVQP